MSLRPALHSAVLAAAGAAGSYPVVRRWSGKRLQRTNFRGEPVTLAEGPASVVGLVLGARRVPGAAGVAAVSGGLGLLDDVAGSGSSRGLGGHFRALRHGEVTTGAIKVLGLGAVGVAAAYATDRGRLHPIGTPTAAALVAGSANLLNLFDLRPGRALKVASLTAVPLLPAQPELSGTVLGVVAALARNDLAGRSMLGDTGANPIGAVLGLALARATGPAGRTVAAGTIVALTLASERVSFSAFIADHPTLRAIDEWGRAR